MMGEEVDEITQRLPSSFCYNRWSQLGGLPASTAFMERATAMSDTLSVRYSWFCASRRGDLRLRTG